MSSTSTDRRWLALALLAAAQFVVVLDASIVNVALPSIGTALDFSQDNLSWVVNAYTLTFGGFLLLGGRMADLLGRRRMFIVGLIVFAGASLAGGLAQSDVWLISARAVQGLGAALLSPAALSLITVLFAEGPDRNKALGVWGAVAGSGGAAGVLLGGMLTEWAGWEWVLFVNVPIGLAAAFLAPRLLPGVAQRRRAPLRHRRRRQHHRGPVAARLLAGQRQLRRAGARAPRSGCSRSPIALIAGFVFIERSTKAPLVPFPGIFRHRSIVGINITGLLIAMALFSMFFFISLYMQQVLGYDALKAGVAYLPLAVGIIISAGLASTLITRFGVRPVLVFGLILTAIGLFWFAQISPSGTYVGDILFPALISAFGLGFSFVPMTVAAVAGVEPHEAGLASGLINTSQQVGGALGLAILAAIANGRTDSLIEDGTLTRGRPDRGLSDGAAGRRRLRGDRRDPRVRPRPRQRA